MAGTVNITVSVLSRHKEYLDALARTEGQKRSDTIRRALDEYAANHPVRQDGGSTLTRQDAVSTLTRQDGVSTLREE